MEILTLLNPRSRRRAKKRSGARKHRTAAQRAATRKLVALNRKRRGGKSVSRSINFKVNSMAKRRSRRYRRNPASRGVSMSTGGAMGLIKPAFVGAAGGLTVNLLTNQIASSLPDTLIEGKMLYVTKAALAMAVGIFGGKLPGLRPYARGMAQGAMTTILYDLGKEMGAGAGINLAGMGRTGYINPGYVSTPLMPGGRTIPGAMGRVAQYLPTPGAQMNGLRGARVGQYIRR